MSGPTSRGNPQPCKPTGWNMALNHQQTRGRGAMGQSIPSSRSPHHLKDRFQEGSIQFLWPAARFTQQEHESLIGTGYLHNGATGHPVVILKRPSSKTALITPVSAYSSGADNGYLPPWRQQSHMWKKLDDFRSFYGSARSSSRPALQLQDGKKMNKPEASWLNIQSVWEVPISVLGPFRYRGCDGVLQLKHDSLMDLQRHIAESCRYYDKSWDLPQPQLRRKKLPIPRPLPSFVAQMKMSHPNGAASGPKTSSSLSWRGSESINNRSPPSYNNSVVPTGPAKPTTANQNTRSITLRQSAWNSCNQRQPVQALPWRTSAQSTRGARSPLGHHSAIKPHNPKGLLQYAQECNELLPTHSIQQPWRAISA